MNHEQRAAYESDLRFLRICGQDPIGREPDAWKLQSLEDYLIAAEGLFPRYGARLTIGFDPVNGWACVATIGERALLSPWVAASNLSLAIKSIAFEIDRVIFPQDRGNIIVFPEV